MPRNYQLLGATVAIAFKSGGMQAALTKIGQLSNDSAHLPTARLLEGDFYVSQKRFDDAVAAYQAALKASPNGPVSGTLTLKLAFSLDAAGHHAQAEQALRSWVTQHPEDLNANQVLAGWDVAEHRLNDAEMELKRILAKRPNDAIALNNLAWVYEERGDPQARQLAQKAYLVMPSPQIADTLGTILAAQNDGQTGIPLLRQAVAQMPGDAEVQYHLAVALNKDGQRDQAITMLTTLVSGPAVFEDKAQARQLLARLTQK